MQPLRLTLVDCHSARFLGREGVCAGHWGATAVDSMHPVGSELFGITAQVLDEAWEEALVFLGTSPVDPNSIRDLLSRRINAALDKGERDPERLKNIALGAVDS
jgi:hypothetical protein